MSERRRLVFFGAGEFGVPTLRALADMHEVAAVVSQPDKPAGRGKAPTPTAISREATALGLDLHRPESCNAEEFREMVRGLGADSWVVIAYGQKLGAKLLEGVFAINLHASLLPRWRGAAPINAAILAGDDEIGNSVITLADKMDAGLILGQSRAPADPSMTAGEVHDELSLDGPGLVTEVLERHAAGTLIETAQDESEVTFASKLSKKDDGWVNFGDTAEACRRRVHGLTPWPGVTVTFRDAPLKLLRVEPADAEAHQAGEPGTLLDATGGLVACGDRTRLRLLKVQAAGKKPMAWADFARGTRAEDGERVIGREEV